jgi:hypothetical protein
MFDNRELQGIFAAQEGRRRHEADILAKKK